MKKFRREDLKQRTGKAEGAGAAVPLFGGVFGGRGEFTPDVNHADSAMNAGKDLRYGQIYKVRLAADKPTITPTPATFLPSM